jgi:hypothetical protein
MRVYEALDVMDLANWNLVDDLEVPGATCFAWGQYAGAPPCLLIGFARGNASVWVYEEAQRKWQEVASLEHREAVHAVAWAPHVGRTIQHLATAGQNGAVRVHTLRMPEAITGIPSHSLSPTGWDVELVGQLQEHSQPVWRVEWNATGTLLASSSDDGTVRVWQPDPTGEDAPAREHHTAKHLLRALVRDQRVPPLPRATSLLCATGAAPRRSGRSRASALARGFCCPRLTSRDPRRPIARTAAASLLRECRALAMYLDGRERGLKHGAVVTVVQYLKLVLSYHRQRSVLDSGLRSVMTKL